VLEYSYEMGANGFLRIILCVFGYNPMLYVLSLEREARAVD
jgi:hypothetical protein